MKIPPGGRLIIQREPIVGHNGRVSTTYPRLVDEVQVGERVLLDDGSIALRVVDKSADELVLECPEGGLVKPRKGCNLPDTELSMPAMTEFDRECVLWSMKHELDFLSLSFVRTASDIRQLKDMLLKRGVHIPVIAKIEKPQAVAHAAEIIEAADGVMVARGDLGVEMDLARVPLIQKDIIRRARVACKPVIVATQMLQSMIESSTPTRAETSDIANAIIDGTDAIMLSGETSVGKYPLEAVKTMAHVAATTEAFLFDRLAENTERIRVATNAPYTAIADGALAMAWELDVSLVVCWSTPHYYARILSKLRCPVPIVALAEDAVTLRCESIHFGVLPMEMAVPDSFRQRLDRVDQLLLLKGLVKPGDTILQVGERAGRTHGAILHVVQQP